MSGADMERVRASVPDPDRVVAGYPRWVTACAAEMSRAEWLAHVDARNGQGTFSAVDALENQRIAFLRAHRLSL